MQTTLLSTKLVAPPTGLSQVSRPRLNTILSKGLTRALTLVCAPAGYGKTSLVSAWLNLGDVHSTWLSLDEDDDDPIRFLQYFLTAIQKVIPAVRIDLLDMLQGSQTEPYNLLMSFIINLVAENAAVVADNFILVLDDFHAIHAQPILDMLTFLLEHMPPEMHVILLARTDPPLPVARLRARNQLVEIRAEHLQFTAEEITAFLNKVMGLEVAAADVSAIEARTEGWIAGLQLAALSMQGCKDIHSFISAFSGSHSYIMDYLVEEVLRLQTEQVRTFLLETSILDRLCGPLCEAVTQAGRPDPIPGQVMLEALEQNHLFIIPLDHERRWYRYHQLFNDVLNRRLQSTFPRIIPELHRGAAQWYEQNGFIHQAVRHALKSGDPDISASLIERHGCSLLMGGEVSLLLNWLESIEPTVRARPWLAMQYSWALILSGRFERAEQTIQAGERMIFGLEQTSEIKTLLGSFAAGRAQLANNQADAGRAAEYARQALGYLADNSDFTCSLRSVSTSLLGDACWISGKLDEARRAYTEAALLGQAADNPHMVIMANTNLAGVLMEQGQLRQAEKLYQTSLQMANRVDGQNSPFAGKISFGLGSIFYETNQFEEAVPYFEQCMRLCQQWGDLYLQNACTILMARLAKAQGNMEKAREATQAAERMYNDCRHPPKGSNWVAGSLGRLFIEQGNTEKALVFLRDRANFAEFNSSGNAGAIEIPYLLEPIFMALVRLYLVNGNYEAALAVSERILVQAEAAGQTGLVIETLVLVALAFQGEKKINQAWDVLERAILLAQPEEARRVFLDEGEPVARLLIQAKSQAMENEYAEKLLASIIKELKTAKPREEPARTGLVEIESPQGKKILAELLTERELEVLKLIEAGCSNSDIAARLVISPKTVKRHISNIYSKFGATSRTQAVSFGRTLGLLMYKQTSPSDIEKSPIDCGLYFL